MKHNNLIEQITNIRANNNVLWMRLAELALEHAPVHAKAALRQINNNDREVSELLRILAK